MKKATKDPFALRALRFVFRIYEKIAPAAAARWGYKLFLTPIHYPIPERELKALQKATLFHVDCNGTPIQCYSWGEGPVVLFVHGWAGRGLQVSEFIEPLVAQGMRVVAFDAQAHGKTPGKQTNLPAMAEALMLVVQELEELHAIVTHSFGATVTALGFELGLSVDTVAFISAPTIGAAVITEYLRRINGSIGTGEYIKLAIERDFHRSYESLALENTIHNMDASTNVLIVHDRGDIEAPFFHAERLEKLLPNPSTFYTDGLGHTRLLRNPELLFAVTEHIKAPLELEA